MNFKDYMEASNLTLEITQVVTILVFVGGWFKLWYEMKQKMALQNQEIKYLKGECMEVKDEFDKLESEVRKNKEDFSIQYNQLGKEIGKVYIKIESTKSEILAAIANIKK